MAIQKSCFLLVAFAVALLLAGPIATTGSTVYASENSVEISQADIDQATSNLATVLEEAYTSDPNVTEETVAKNIMLYLDCNNKVTT